MRRTAATRRSLSNGQAMSAMHVAIHAHLINRQAGYRGAGVSNYSQHLVRALGDLACAPEVGHRFTVFLNERDYAAPGVTLQVSSWPTRRPGVRIVWEQTVLPRQLGRAQVDLVHGLVNVLPLATRTAGVVTVHDLSFMILPEKFPTLKRWYLRAACRASVAQARRVIAVSRQTADDLVAWFQVPAGKIVVVPNGVEDRFCPAPAPQVAEFRVRQGLPQRYLLYVGTLEPRKNLERLVAAFAAWLNRAAIADREVKLVLAGGRGWFYDPLFRLVATLDLAGQVLFPGFIPPHELPDWYRAAEGFVYPSLYEGFGLPVLEAMACGTPVLCSNRGSLAEIAGTSALTCDPSSVEDLVAGIGLLTGQPALRRELQRLGLTRAELYSWRRTARETVAVYEMAVDRPKGH